MSSQSIKLTAIHHLLARCGSVTTGEKVLVVVDDTTVDLAADFLDTCRLLGASGIAAQTDVANRHGIEPVDAVAGKFHEYDLVVGLTKMSMAHTRARKEFTEHGGRYLSMPGYSDEVLLDPSIMANYHTQLPTTRKIADAFSAGNRLRITSPSGTEITLDIQGREGNCCPGFVDSTYRLGSPPDIEANISPIEGGSHGIVIVDGSVTCDEVGLLQAPLTLGVESGHIREISCSDASCSQAVANLLASVGRQEAYILAECGVGLNPLARLTGNMLIDEGAMGCVHFGFGSNITIGGRNDVPFHLDFVFRNASVWVDDRCILDTGTPV